MWVTVDFSLLKTPTHVYHKVSKYQSLLNSNKPTQRYWQYRFHPPQRYKSNTSEQISVPMILGSKNNELCANTHWDLPLLTPALKSISYIQRWCKRNNVSCCTSLKQDYDHLEQNNDMQWFVFTTVFIIWESGLYLWNIWTWCCLIDCQARYNWLTDLILFDACWRILP